MAGIDLTDLSWIGVQCNIIQWPGMGFGHAFCVANAYISVCLVWSILSILKFRFFGLRNARNFVSLAGPKRFILQPLLIGKNKIVCFYQRPHRLYGLIKNQKFIAKNKRRSIIYKITAKINAQN